MMINTRRINTRRTALRAFNLLVAGLLGIFTAALMPLATAERASAAELAPTEESQHSAEYWLERLQAPSFSARRQANRRLAEMGLEAIKALGEGARSPEPEVAQRCFDMLARHFESGTPNVREAAEKQLQTLADDDNPALASRAQNVLTPQPQSSPMRPTAPNLGQVRQRIAIRMANGKRTIEVERNGKKTILRIEGDKHIVERPGTVPPTPPAEYENEQALEKGDPEAFRLLKQFGAGRIKIIRRGKPGQPIKPSQPIKPGQLQIQIQNLFGKPPPQAPAAPEQDNIPKPNSPEFGRPAAASLRRIIGVARGCTAG